MTKKLTDLAIRKLAIPDKGQKTYWEDGFGVRVSQGGSKSFVVMLGTERRLKTIGRYPDMSLKTARDEAAKLKVAGLPSQHLKSLSEARTAYLSECERKNRPATVHVYRNFLMKLDKPALTDVTKEDIDLSSPHAVTTWKVFFNWCMRNELVERNPFTFERVQYGSRERVLTTDEIKKLWHYDCPPFSDYLKLLLLTGQRRGQLTDYEIRDDTVFFPSRIMKNKKDHTIPLGALARPILERLETFNGWSKSKSRCDLQTGVKGWTLHDCRRSFSTYHAQLGTPIHVTEKLLAHTGGTISGVAATYNRASRKIALTGPPR